VAAQSTFNRGGRESRGHFFSHFRSEGGEGVATQSYIQVEKESVLHLKPRKGGRGIP